MECNPLARLSDLGQSVWCDDIGRDLLLADVQASLSRTGYQGSPPTPPSSTKPSQRARPTTKPYGLWLPKEPVLPRSWKP